MVLSGVLVFSAFYANNQHCAQWSSVLLEEQIDAVTPNCAYLVDSVTRVASP